MNNKIKEISDIISDHIEFCDVGGGSVSIDEDEAAKAIYDAGYRKQIWHKVADEELPETDKLVLCFKRDGRGNRRYTTGYLDCNSLWLLQDGSIFPERIDVVIAWAELLEYEE